MEKELLESMVGKRISFHKMGSPHLLFGDVVKVTDTSIALTFRGRLQVHTLNSLIDVEESEERHRQNDTKRCY